ncbi:MAG: ABC transporter ATP-binding protein [Acidobacteriia bacterium]|nr:ABC transporter ATP-binding protein [Terriglobia bacterium]
MLIAEFSKQLISFQVEVSLTAEPGSTFVLVGESGAGKTTILNILAGLIQPDHGRIKLEDLDLFDSEQGIIIPANERPIGYVFQDYVLFPHLTVFENVAFGLRAQGLGEMQVRRETRGILDQLGIEDLAPRKPRRLSGGQRQRVALARSLVLKPRLLLLDEPLSAIDLQTRREVRTELRRILAGLPCITLFVTHSPFEALVFGSQVGVVDHGKLIQVGDRDELLRRPRSRYVAEIMGLNLFQGKVSSRDATGLAEVQTPNGVVHTISDDLSDMTFITVDPREVTLHILEPSGTAQNVFSGPILEMVPEPPQGERVRVVLGTHPPLVAEITAHSMHTLGLREGLNVFASFKATAAKCYN